MSAEILNIKRQNGVAGQYAYTVKVQYEDEEPTTVNFYGNSFGDASIIMEMGGNPQTQTYVSDPYRFGPKLDESWVRNFFATTASRKTALIYGDLPRGNASMACANEDCPEFAMPYSANQSDYFWANPGDTVVCSECGEPMQLVEAGYSVEFLGQRKTAVILDCPSCGNLDVKTSEELDGLCPNCGSSLEVREARKTALTDATGLPVAFGADELGMPFYPTPCCGASGKGSTNSETGVVCRACYREVDEIYGMVPDVPWVSGIDGRRFQGPSPVEGSRNTSTRKQGAFAGYIVGVDAGGPFEVMGDASETEDTPEAAFDSIYGFWNEVSPVNKQHIRIYDGDEYVYSWSPSNPGVLESHGGGPNIPVTASLKLAYDPELAGLGDLFQRQIENMPPPEDRAETLPCPDHGVEAAKGGTFASFPSAYTEYHCPEGHIFRVRPGTTREEMTAEGSKTSALIYDPAEIDPDRMYALRDEANTVFYTGVWGDEAKVLMEREGLIAQEQSGGIFFARKRASLSCSCPVMCVECTTAKDGSTIHCGDHPCVGRVSRKMTSGSGARSFIEATLAKKPGEYGD